MLLEGVESFLSQQQGVCNIVTRSFTPTPPKAITRWEETTGLTLPFDVKSFYTSYGTVQMTWQYSHGNTTEDVGSIYISLLSDLIVIDPSTFTQEEGCYYKALLPSLLSNSVVVIFDSSPFIGQMCLLYKSSVEGYTFDGIWMIDLSMDMHKISSTFSEYLRLAIVHLGLPEWQNLILPDRQLSPSNIVWYELFLPKRLEMDLCNDDTDSNNQLDTFLPKVHVIKLTTPSQQT